MFRYLNKFNIIYDIMQLTLKKLNLQKYLNKE